MLVLAALTDVKLKSLELRHLGFLFFLVVAGRSRFHLDRVSHKLSVFLYSISRTPPIKSTFVIKYLLATNEFDWTGMLRKIFRLPITKLWLLFQELIVHLALSILLLFLLCCRDNFSLSFVGVGFEEHSRPWLSLSVSTVCFTSGL